MSWISRGVVLLVALEATACFDVKTVDPGIEVVPDETGIVDPARNALGISGRWFSYGDQYDAPRACTEIGKHSPNQCSSVSVPEPLPELGFPNRGGRMCTFGSAAQVVACCEKADEKTGCTGTKLLPCDETSYDYSNIWGAGIGLDFGLPVDDAKRDPLDRSTWNAVKHGIVGIGFDFLLLDGGALDAPHVRVEFPILMPYGQPLPDGKGTASLKSGPVDITEAKTPGLPFPDQPPPSEEHPSGSPFWGAPETWGDSDVSPVREGHNVVRFDAVNLPPLANYELDLTQLLGVQFHVPPLKNERLDYGFCISNLTFLRE